MDDSDRLRREIQALRDRMTQLSRATLRINESLEFETVLQGNSLWAGRCLGAWHRRGWRTRRTLKNISRNRTAPQTSLRS